MGEQTQSNLQQCNLSGQEGLQQIKTIKIPQLPCDDEAPQLNRPADSLLQRIDHLDIILNTMEDKAPTEPSSSPSTSPRPTSRRHSSAPTTPFGLEKRCKPTVSVLEEIREKGTLVERVSDLEKRVMKLHRMLSLKSNENVEHASASHMTGLPHRRVMSHQEVYDRQLLQEPVDVEKHEVTLSCSDPLECKGHIEPSINLSSHFTHSPESERPQVGQYEEMVSSGKISDVEHDPRAPPQQSKKKRLRIKKWLSKHLHIHLPGTPQEKHSGSNGHCWGPQIQPKNCWNVRKKDMNTTQYTHCGRMSTDDE